VLRRVKDWFRQAEAALSSARKNMELGDFWVACFMAHQAAEYALKAVFQGMGIERKSHSIYRLLEELGTSERLLTIGRKLDRHYLQSRYVNTFHEGAPIDYYGSKDAEEAVECGEKILSFCRRRLKKT
jgi:HEPN domain-containing protein